MAYAREHLDSAVLLAGDSAGAGLAICGTASLVAEGSPPVGLVTLSAFVDFTLESTSIAESTDPWAIPRQNRKVDMRELVAVFLRGDDPRSASPLYSIDFRSFPPVFAHAAEGEDLADDTRALAVALREKLVSVTEHWTGLSSHAFVIFDPWSGREATETWEAIGHWAEPLFSAM